MVFVLFNLFFFLLKHITYTKECMDFEGLLSGLPWCQFSLPTKRILKTKFHVNHFLFAVVSSLHNILFMCLALPFIKEPYTMHSSLICSFYSILLSLKFIHLVGIAVIYSFLLLWNILLYDCIMICFSIYHRYSFGFVVGSGIWTMFSFNIGWEFLYRTYLGLQLLNHRVQTHFCLKQCQTVLQSYY